MTEFVTQVFQTFDEARKHERAVAMSAYLKNHFPFFGIGAVERKELFKPFLTKAYLPDKQEAWVIVQQLWALPEREMQYCAMELLSKYKKQLYPNDLPFIEALITNKSWWDTVDFLASHMIGAYLLKFPNQRKTVCNRWLTSHNIWLQRTALIFQLKYKNEVDKELLSANIVRLLGSKEFFINKAIGWALRAYAQTNPRWVLNFVANHTLHPLSKREALKHF